MKSKSTQIVFGIASERLGAGSLSPSAGGLAALGIAIGIAIGVAIRTEQLRQTRTKTKTKSKQRSPPWHY